MKVAVFLLAFTLITCGPVPKQLNGPPSEFSLHAIPEPTTGALTSNSLEQKMKFAPTARWNATEELEFHAELPVDGEEIFAFCYMSPHSASVTFKLFDPKGNQVDLASNLFPSSFPLSDDNSKRVPSTCYAFRPGQHQTGIYSLEGVLTPRDAGHLAKLLSTPTHGLLYLYNQGEISLHSNVQNYLTHTTGQELGVSGRIFNAALPLGSDGVPEALKDVVITAVLDIVTPSGEDIEVPMHDDGLHGDGAENDGVFGGSIIAQEAGMYSIEVVMTGDHASGIPFSRSTTQLVAIVPNLLKFSGKASGQMVSVASNEGVDTRLRIDVGVTAANNGPDATKFRPYAQLWGKSAAGEDVPVCWVSGMADVQSDAAQHFVSLFVDPRWIAQAQAVAPFSLRGMYISDANLHIPLDSAADMPLSMAAFHTQHLALEVSKHAPGAVTITQEMRNGPRPAFVNTTAPSYTLILTHGYCSDENPFQDDTHIFTDAGYFLNPSASLSNDAFALKIAEFAKGSPDFGMVGHSQGGLVAAHLLNYYHTGLSNAQNGIQIQSIGSPYLGNSGAGSAANLIKVFGYGCGENYDLTTDGARLWLSGITSETRSEIEYYTTQYSTGNWINYCNLAVNLVLKWPNDGTCEKELAQLPGAKNMGHKTAWCHSVEMSDPPQYDDESRNRIFNQMAAR